MCAEKDKYDKILQITSMYSPTDRNYNSPDLAVPAAELVLQQIRLERVLRRIGYLSTCKSSRCMLPKTVPVKLPAIPTTNTLTPFIERTRYPTDLLHSFRHENRNLGIKEQRALGLVKNKHDFEKYYSHPQKTCDQFFNKFQPKCHPKSEILKPFYPNKSPVKLPVIQKCKSKNVNVTTVDPIKHDELRKHIEQYRKEKSKMIPKSETKKKHKRRKKANMERYFQKWQEVYDKSMRCVDYDRDLADFHILQGQEKFHPVPDHDNRQQEQVFRDRISNEIKRSIRNKKSLHEAGLSTARDNIKLVPVTDLVFEKRSDFKEDIFVHRKKRRKPVK